MKGKRLKDVLDDKVIDRRFWEKIFFKMNNLLVAMKTSKGNYNIDDPEIRWVEDRIEYWNGEERLLTPQEMSQANHYWKKYK
tara:strand:- start:109 stop:354 length:246 start_codon:yes stop_codon:yes gene_type:complete